MPVILQEKRRWIHWFMVKTGSQTWEQNSAAAVCEFLHHVEYIQGLIALVTLLLIEQIICISVNRRKYHKFTFLHSAHWGLQQKCTKRWYARGDEAAIDARFARHASTNSTDMIFHKIKLMSTVLRIVIIICNSKINISTMHWSFIFFCNVLYSNVAGVYCAFH